MDETTRGHTTTFTRAARTRRMLDCLREGWSYRDVASVENLSERRVRQIVGAHLRRFEPVDEDIHAALQVERLGFAVKMAGEALAKGDIRAIAPYIKAIDRLDAYQTRARKAAPQPSHEGDALVVKMLVDRIERGVKAEMAAAAAAASPDPVAAQSPVIEAEPTPPPIEPESPVAAEAPSTAAAPVPPPPEVGHQPRRRAAARLLGSAVPAASRAGEAAPRAVMARRRGAARPAAPGAGRRAFGAAEHVELRNDEL